MPWNSADASSKTHKANSPKKQAKWAAVANAVLEKTGDDASAIRIANAQMNRYGSSERKKK